MKRNFLLSTRAAVALIAFFMIGFSASINAQVIFEEDFEDGLPEDWESTFNEPGQGWMHGDEATLTSQYFTFPENVFAGNAFMGANDDGCMPNGEAPTSAANCDSSMDYLITPSIDLSDYPGVVLSFNAFYTGAYNSLMNIDISGDGGETWDENVYEVGDNTAWTNHVVPISDYGGLSDVKIRFHHDDNGGTTSWASGAGVDDVMLAVPDFNDMAVRLNHKTVDYASFPLSQLGEEGFGEINAELINLGVDATDVTVTVSIDSLDFSTDPISFANVASYTSEAQDVGAGQSTTISLGSDFEAENAFYVIRTSVDYAEIDEDVNEANNEHIHVTQLNEFFISRALTLNFAALEDSTIAPEGFALTLGGDNAADTRNASSFDIYEASYVEQVNISIQNPEGLTRIGIFESDPDSSPAAEPLYESGFFDPADFAELTPDQINTVPVPITCPPLLEPGKYWISVYEQTGANVNLVYSTHYLPLGQSVYLSGEDFSDVWWANPNSIMPLIDVALTQELSITSPATNLELSDDASGFEIDIDASVTDDDGFLGGFCEITWTVDGDVITEYDGQTSFNYEFDAFGTYEVCAIVESLDGTELEECVTVELECSLDADEDVTPGSITIEVDGGSGNYEYDWSNGDDSEEATGLEPGTEYTVVVSDGDCEQEFTFETAECDVSVSEDGISYDNNEATIELDIDNSYYSTSGATNEHTITWTNEDGDEVGDELTVTVDASGTYTATVSDPAGCEATVEVDVSIVDIETIEGLANFEMYPNPTANEVTIDFDLDRNVDFQLTIFNVAGERVMETATQELNTFTQTFDLSEFANGVYMVQLTFDNKVMMERLMISK